MNTVKKLNFKLFALALIVPITLGLSGCQKGKDDPFLSVKSRTNRIAQDWNLEQTKKNGATETTENDLVVTWDMDEDGTITETREDVVLGVQTSETNTGTWQFETEKEEVRINLDGNNELFIIDRLSSKDLWLRQIEDGDVYEWIFEKQ